jgi:hypothetical protein
MTAIEVLVLQRAAKERMVSKARCDSAASAARGSRAGSCRHAWVTTAALQQRGASCG